MPPKKSFTKEHILRHALALIKEEGLASLSARKLAQRMGSSTAPVYQAFESMAALQEEVMTLIKEIALDHTKKDHADRRFLSIGMGFIIFARDDKELFKAFHLENQHQRHLVDELFDELKADMLNDARFTHLNDVERQELLDKMWTFAFGMSTQICYGLIESPTDAYIEKKLVDTGTIIIKDALSRAGKTSNQ